MAMDLTIPQGNARDARGGILVAAAAGSGKTRVLTERVIKKLTDENNPVDADKLLIVTFTNSAALEMRTRIENALLDAIDQDPSNEKLLEQYNKLGAADISTIDSFCINIVRENFEACGVDQNFSVTNGNDLVDIKNGVLSELIDEQLVKNDPRFLKLLEYLDCEKNDNKLQERIKDIYKKSNTVPFPDVFFENLKKPYLREFSEGHPWFDDAFEYAEKVTKQADPIISEMWSLVDSVNVNSEKVSDEIKYFENLFKTVETIISEQDWDKMTEYVIPSKRRSVSITVASAADLLYKNDRETLKEIFESLKFVFPYKKEETNHYLKLIAPSLVLLFDLVKEFSDRVFDAFVENNTLAFYHTEQLALSLLCSVSESGEIIRTPVADDYINRYEEVMVDEYQDVNDLQELMFEILSDNQQKLFVVGDVKQSIFRFRGSNPKNFLKKKNNYTPYVETSDKPGQKIILSENFRSRECICDFVNFVFEKLLTKETGGIVYDDEEKLNNALKLPENNDEVTDLLVVNNSSDSEDTYSAEANAIAKYISDMMRSGKTVTKNKIQVPVNYGDFCILLESTKRAPIIVKALKKHGIPVSYNSEDYCKSPEISLILSLLTVIDNPLKNVDLLAVLMSPMFGFSPDDILSLRKKNSDDYLYRAVLTGAKCGDNKCNDFIERIRLFKRKSIVMPVSQFINYLVYETEIFSIISSLDNSNHRRKNVYFLLNLAKNSTDNGIGAFVERIRSLPDDTFAMTDNDDASVKIMTMHKSKGLQFPICIVANLSKEFNTDDFKGKYMMSDKYGFTFKPFIEDNNAFLENCGIELAKIEERTEFIAERIRLLYVALTRAEEKLVLVTGLVKKPGISSIAEKLISGTLSPYNINKSHSFGQMILSVCLMHPDAKKLRELAGVDLPRLPTKSKLNVIICDGCDDELKSDVAREFVPEERSDLIEMMRRNIAYQYPNEKLSGILAKTSVSALSHSSVENEYSFTDRPSFMNEDGISAPEKGTAVHKIMQFIDFTSAIDIDSEIERLVEWRFITEKEGEIADRRKLKAFFDSALYQRVLRSSDIKREMRFLTEIKAGKIGDVPPEFYDKQVIVQGAVDLLFFEDDGIVIVDFKTDRVDDPEKLRELYSEQLKLYATACSKKFDRPVKELIIYSFALSKEIKLQS